MSTTQIVRPGRHDGPRVDPSKLTPREAEVAKLLSTGLTQAAAARQLGVSRRTIEQHASAAQRKTGTTSSFELAVAVAAGRVRIE